MGDPDGMYYNCHHARDFADLSGLTRLGIHHVPPIVARGVVLDMAVEQKQGTPIREGDVVLFHTGWTDALLEPGPAAWAAGEPGQGEEVARYLAGKNVVAVGADTWGVDAMPPGHCSPGRPGGKR
jgi:kynurenine formamidase